MFVVTPIDAQPLEDVLATTYRHNPALLAARAQLRETDELLAQAISGYWPQISFSATEGRQNSRVTGGGTSGGNISSPGFSNQINEQMNQQSAITDEKLTDRQVELLAVLNIYAGGRDAANVNYAKAVIAAGQARLQNSEQTVLFEAARAYTDIVYYTLLRELASESVQDLQRLKEMTDSLFSKQLATITSSAQVDANLASARIEYDATLGDLQSARTRYVAVVGDPAPDLQDWPNLPVPPATLQESLDKAKKNNLEIIFSQNMLEASKYTLRINQAALYPVVDLYNSLTWYWDKTRYTNSQDFSENDSERLIGFGVQLNLPLYQGGSSYSKIRQSKQAVVSKRFDLANTRNNAEQEVRSSWIDMSTARKQLQYAADQIKAATIAYTGLQREFKSGSVTMTDVLTGQTNLIDANANKYQATYNMLVAVIELLVGIGEFQAAYLKLPVPMYDPEQHLEEIRYKRFGVD